MRPDKTSKQLSDYNRLEKRYMGEGKEVGKNRRPKSKSIHSTANSWKKRIERPERHTSPRSNPEKRSGRWTIKYHKKVIRRRGGIKKGM